MVLNRGGSGCGPGEKADNHVPVPRAREGGAQRLLGAGERKGYVPKKTENNREGMFRGSKKPLVKRRGAKNRRREWGTKEGQVGALDKRNSFFTNPRKGTGTEMSHLERRVKEGGFQWGYGERARRGFFK